MRLIHENKSHFTDHDLPNIEKLADICDVIVKKHVSPGIYFIYFHMLAKNGNWPQPGNLINLSIYDPSTKYK